ncbi:general transcription factor IIH subunit 5 isoform X1 [Drosophila miranda]|nr:general transcription factor IIH subunit 5 isoform X1 [Drosophila miranda]
MPRPYYFSNIHKLCRIFGKYILEMVNVMKGVLVECDPAMKQFLLHLDEKLALGRKFIIQDLDESHLFISTDIVEVLQARVDDLMDRISFPLHDKDA